MLWLNFISKFPLLNVELPLFQVNTGNPLSINAISSINWSTPHHTSSLLVQPTIVGGPFKDMVTGKPSDGIEVEKQ